MSSPRQLDPSTHLAAQRLLGVCSWSLRPGSARELAAGVAKFGIRRVQLALDPIRENRPGWGEIETIHALRLGGGGRVREKGGLGGSEAVRAAPIQIASGMMAFAGEDYSTLESIARTGGVRPTSTWKANLLAAKGNARLARRLGIGLVTFHAGFIPHEGGAERGVMIRRLREMVDVFDDCGVRVGFETGQESAATLLEALDALDRPHAGVNFDPANMILYGMGDPVKALDALASRVVQIHIKDAKPARKRGAWGTEVVAGTGAVNWNGFFDAMKSRGVMCPLIVEREAGERRLADACAARNLVLHQLQRTGVGA